MRKKILIINAAVWMGGDVSMFILGLSFFDPQEYEFHVVSVPHGKIYQHLSALPNAKITTMELGGTENLEDNRVSALRRAFTILFAILRIVTIVRKEKVDIIYALDRTVSTSLSYFVSLLTGCPLVLSAHISHYLHISPLMRRIVKHAVRITVPSNDTRSEFLPFVKSPQRVVTVFNALNIDRYDLSISGTSVRSELHIDPAVPVVLLAARLSPFKGQDDLIRAAAIIHTQHPAVRFLLAGAENAGYDAVLEQMIADYHLEGVVKLIGYRNDLPQVLAACTILAMPSHGESFGLVALEAMAMARPVVASRAGGISEFLIDGQMGILIEPRDHKALAQAILDLVNDPVRAREMGRRGRQQVEAGFTVQTYGPAIVASLNAVIEECRATPRGRARASLI